MGELHSLEKNTVVVVCVLFSVHDVAAIGGDPTRYVGDDARCIGARDQQCSADCHKRGDDGNRTHDIYLAKVALCQLSYVPVIRSS